MPDPLPPPPTTDAARRDWLRLIRSPRVGPVTFRRLLAEHGSAAAALQALPDIAKAAGVDSYTPCPLDKVDAELARGRKSGAALLALGEDTYPIGLTDLADAPPVLWAYGDPGLGQRASVAVVGARNASALGQRMARTLCAGLGKAGYVVVSGLARGIDAAAHRAALETGTIAVMAGGVDVPYPPENTELARAIFRGGLILSEQPMGLQPTARHFPRRNRLIAGLARGLVVVEAALKSGSLITARDALDQGREVMAVPAHPFDGRAGGANQLIRDGASLVRHADDVLEVLGRPEQVSPSGPVATPAPAMEDTDLRAAILSALAVDPVAEHILGETVRAPADRIARQLTELELDGLISRQGGGMVSRVA